MGKAARERVEVKPALLRWARERAGMQLDDLTRRFPQLLRWESGDVYPTRRQLERFAKATYATVDHLLLAKPPVERVPIPDFRAAGNGRVGRPTRTCWTRSRSAGNGRRGIAISPAFRAISRLPSSALRA